MYKCEICGKEYENVYDRAKCEVACIQSKKAEAEKSKEELERKERQRRSDEVNAAYYHYKKLYTKYLNDYANPTYTKKTDPFNLFFGI